MDLNLKVKLYLQNGEEKFMGIGVLWLLNKVEELHSLRAAAQDLGISYSKAYNMVKNLEKALNKTILVRQKGGQNRNGAVLTPFAKDFLKLYEDFQKECKDLVKQPFDKFQKDLAQLCNLNDSVQLVDKI